MYQFSIRDIENLSGIKAHTLRIWEQRYGLTLCKRKESQHRFYDNDDLKQILRIAYLYKKGYKISKIATFTQDQIKELASLQKGQIDRDVLINQLIESSMDFDEVQFEAITDNSIQHMGIEQFVLKVAYPYMEKIGVLWMTNHIIPAQEHFSSSILQKKLISVIDSLRPTFKKPDINLLLFTPEGEQHELSLLFAQLLFKKQGYYTVLMGKSISIDTLKYYCERKNTTHLYFHLITNFTNHSIDDYILKLASAFPEKKIIAAGPAVINATVSAANVSILKSLNEMLDFTTKV
jgi:MerR family transcriptional regulator, light-induced transcriptional regulator